MLPGPEACSAQDGEERRNTSKMLTSRADAHLVHIGLDVLHAAIVTIGSALTQEALLKVTL